MAKSIFQRLQEALSQGDLELAKSLTDKLAKDNAKVKPKKKNAREQRISAGNSQRISTVNSTKVSPEISPVTSSIPAGRIITPGDSEWMAPSKGKPVTKVGKDGRVLVAGKYVPLNERPRVNHFAEWEKSQGKGLETLSPKDKKFDKKLASPSPVARPGQIGASRPVAAKESVACDGCGRIFEVYQSELTVEHDDDGRPFVIYKCSRCIQRGK